MGLRRHEASRGARQAQSLAEEPDGEAEEGEKRVLYHLPALLQFYCVLTTHKLQMRQRCRVHFYICCSIYKAHNSPGAAAGQLGRQRGQNDPRDGRIPGDL